MSDPKVIVFEEPVFGKSFPLSGRKRKIKEPKEAKEPTLKKLKGEFEKFTARGKKEEKKYRFNTLVQLGAVKEKEKTMPLPLRKAIDAKRKKKQQKDIELGLLDARSVPKKGKVGEKRKGERTRKKKKGGGRPQ